MMDLKEQVTIQETPNTGIADSKEFVKHDFDHTDDETKRVNEVNGILNEIHGPEMGEPVTEHIPQPPSIAQVNKESSVESNGNTPGHHSIGIDIHQVNKQQTSESLFSELRSTVVQVITAVVGAGKNYISHIGVSQNLTDELRLRRHDN